MREWRDLGRSRSDTSQVPQPTQDIHGSWGTWLVRYSTLSWQVMITGRPNPFRQADPINSTSFWPLPYHHVLSPAAGTVPEDRADDSGILEFDDILSDRSSSKPERQSQEEVGASFLNHFRSKQWQQCSVWSSWRAKTHTFSPSKRCNSFLSPIITMILKKTWF